MRSALLVVLMLVLQPAVFFAQGVLAERPPMGWNSWDSYGLTINEAQFRDNVKVLATTLKPFGWQYAVIDEGWFMKNPQDRSRPEQLVYEMDGNGRYNPVPERFPSALVDGRNTGFKSLGAFVHAQGLKFGIHIVRGVPRESVKRNLPIAGSAFKTTDAADEADACPWDPTNWGVRDSPAGQAWYDALVAQYAAWGVDLLKVDCISDHPYRPGEIRMLHQAIVKSGRPIVLSLSPGPTSPGLAKDVQAYAQMWRISDDFWDYWRNTGFPRNLHDQFELAAAWAPFAGPGSWPDADMLPVGYLGPEPGVGTARNSRLTPVEQRTLLTLWSMMRSPLILGANLTKLDAATKELLTNREVLEVDQEGRGARQVSREGDMVAWTSDGPGGARYLALFNLGETEKIVARPYVFYNLTAGMFGAKELWTGVEMPAAAGVRIAVAPHGCVLLRLVAGR